jgi:hypothetical protein
MFDYGWGARALRARVAELELKLADTRAELADTRAELASRTNSLEDELLVGQKRNGTINQYESQIANLEAQLLDAQRLSEKSAHTISELELALSTGADRADVAAARLVPPSPLEDVLQKYGLTELARSIKLRRTMLEKRVREPMIGPQ